MVGLGGCGWTGCPPKPATASAPQSLVDSPGVQRSAGPAVGNGPYRCSHKL